MSLDWDKIESEAASKSFKQFANNGEHTVRVDEVKQNNNGNGWFDMTFVESEVKYPKLSFPLFSDEKKNFRAHYYKEIMKLLGVPEDAARKAVDTCENKSSRSEVHKAYAEAFSRLSKKHPQIKIEVRDQYDRDGNPVMSENGTVYGESVFAKDSGLQFKSRGAASTTTNSTSGDVFDGASDASNEVDLTDLPF